MDRARDDASPSRRHWDRQLSANATLDGLLAQARAAMSGGTGADFARAMRRVILFEPAFANGLLAWGEQAARRSGIGDAVVLLRRGTLVAPLSARIHLALADAAFRQGRPETTARHGWRAAIIDPARRPPYRAIAIAMVATNARHHALRIFASAACLGPHEARDLLVIAQAAHDLDRLAESDAAIRRHLVLQPDSRHGSVLRLRLVSRRNGPVETVNQIARVRVLAPSDPLIPLARARMALGARDHSRAVGLFRRAVAMAPEHAAACFDLARALQAAERFPAAERAMTWSCAIDPGFGLKSQVLRLAATERDFRATVP